jgi:hypothetical protein
VRAGFHGSQPSLTRLDRQGNPFPEIDFHQLYANIVTNWLGGDAAAVIGRQFGDLGVLAHPGAGPPSGPVAASGSRRAGVVGLRAQVARLYLAYFLRDPDDDGFDYWTGLALAGRSLAAISAEFAASPEFARRYGALPNARFVELVYTNVLDRAPDPDGRSHWISVLDRGVSRGEVMIGFSESPEFVTTTGARVRRIERNGPIGRLYRAYFLRSPDDQGLDYWLNTGLPAAAVSDQFAASTEFRRRYGAVPDDRFVDLVYANVLDRRPDGAGRRYWLDELGRGRSRGSVMLALSGSPEFVKKVARSS